MRGQGRTRGLVAEQDGVAVGELSVRIAGGVAGAGDARDLSDAAAAQLVQHQRCVVVLLRLLVVGLDAAYEMQLRPARDNVRTLTTLPATSVLHANKGRGPQGTPKRRITVA